LAKARPNVTTLSGAVNLSFDILGQFMIAFNRYGNSFKLTATVGMAPDVARQETSFVPLGRPAQELPFLRMSPSTVKQPSSWHQTTLDGG
jgi:hypothetical protein